MQKFLLVVACIGLFFVSSIPADAAGEDNLSKYCKLALQGYHNSNCSQNPQTPICRMRIAQLEGKGCPIGPSAPAKSSSAPKASTSNATPKAAPNPSGAGDALPNVLAPAGVTIGMQASEAFSVLADSGFIESSPCSFRKTENGRWETISLRGTDSAFTTIGPSTKIKSDKHGSCSGLVKTISYRNTNPAFELSTFNAVNRLNAQIGATPACNPLTKTNAHCTWKDVPNSSLVESATVRYYLGSRDFRINLIGKKDLASEDTSKTAIQESSNTKADVNSGGSSSLIEPEGVGIGMAVWQIKPVLKKNGFRPSSRCGFRTESSDGRWKTLKVRTVENTMTCAANEVISQVSYAAIGFDAPLPTLILVSKYNELLGAAGKCGVLSDEKARCIWESPPGAPLLRQIVLATSKGRTSLVLRAVTNIRAQVSPPPAPGVERPKYWWEVDLERAEKTGKGKPFSPGESYEGLTPDLQNRISNEAGIVRNYCEKRELFAKLHDCGCVAERFIDERAAMAEQAPWHNPPEGELISMADDLADQCPNKAGVASHGYSECKSTYAYILPDNLETFCACYADQFASSYMEDPRSFFPNIGRAGSNAILECSKTISPNPLGK